MRLAVAATALYVAICGFALVDANADELPTLPAPASPPPASTASTAPPAEPAPPAPVEPPPLPPAASAQSQTVNPTPSPPPTEVRQVAPRFFTFSIGYGVSAAEVPRGTTGSTGDGIYVMGEYWAKPFSWLHLRSYVGFLGTSANQTECQLAGGCDVSEDIGFVGGKLRLLAPIPYVAPFIETGLGLSFGTIHATDVGVDRTTTGAVLDIPLGFGLSLLAQHNFDVMISYLFHLGAEAFGGAISIGLTIPAP